MDKRFIVTSIVKEELKARSGLGTISTEALDWVNDQVSGILDVCAAGSAPRLAFWTALAQHGCLFA